MQQSFTAGRPEPLRDLVRITILVEFESLQKHTSITIVFHLMLTAKWLTHNGCIFSSTGFLDGCQDIRWKKKILHAYRRCTVLITFSRDGHHLAYIEIEIYNKTQRYSTESKLAHSFEINLITHSITYQWLRQPRVVEPNNKEQVTIQQTFIRLCWIMKWG